MLFSVLETAPTQAQAQVTALDRCFGTDYKSTVPGHTIKSDVVYLVTFEVVVEDDTCPKSADHENHAHDGRQQPQLDEHDGHLGQFFPGRVNDYGIKFQREPGHDNSNRKRRQQRRGATAFEGFHARCCSHLDAYVMTRFPARGEFRDTKTTTRCGS